MGGLLSSDADIYSQREKNQRRERENQRRSREILHKQLRDYELARRTEYENATRRMQYDNDIARRLQSLTIQQTEEAAENNVYEITPNPKIISKFLADLNEPLSNQIHRAELIAFDRELSTVRHLFTTTNKRCYKIIKIEKAFNPYLLIQFRLKKMEYIRKYGAVEIMNLFHGTKVSNLDNICNYNFNWRLKGSSRGHKFGQGVSFTPIANYATHYGDKSCNKVMILTKVLVTNQCIGDQYTILPPHECDTTTNGNQHVFVKYEDNTFYPEFIIHYEGYDSMQK